MVFREELHVTQVQTYLLCGQKFKLARDGARPAFRNKASVIGSAFHYALSQDIQPRDAVNIAVYEDDTPLRGKITDEDLEKLALWIRGYHRFLAECGIEIKERERQIRYNPANIVGTIDAIAVHQDTPVGMVEIHDYKTGRMMPQEALTRNFQFSMYRLLAMDAGYKVNRIFWCRVQDLEPYKENGKGGKKGDFRGPFLYPCEYDTLLTMNMLFLTMKALNRGIYLPNGAQGYEPHCPSCEYEHACPKWGEVPSVFERALQEQERLVREHGI